MTSTNPTAHRADPYAAHFSGWSDRLDRLDRLTAVISYEPLVSIHHDEEDLAWVLDELSALGATPDELRTLSDCPLLKVCFASLTPDTQFYALLATEVDLCVLVRHDGGEIGTGEEWQRTTEGLMTHAAFWEHLESLPDPTKHLRVRKKAA